MIAQAAKRFVGNAFLDRYKDLVAMSGMMNKIIPIELPNVESVNQLGLKEVYFQGPKGMDVEAINQGFLHPVHDLLTRPGKQWRPALILMMAEALGKDIHNYQKHQDLYYTAAICELMHNASLISDDMEDSSEMRRGDKCLHLKYGIDVAVNATTFLFMQPLTKINSYIKNCMYEYQCDYIDESCRLHLGQCLDIVWHKSNIIPTELQYLQMVSNKTGVNPRLGMKLLKHIYSKEISQGLAKKMVVFGEQVGIAFQIIDDILNIKDCLLSKGKGIIGEDIKEGKRTLMVIHSVNGHTSKAKSKRLVDILAMHTGDNQLINEAISIMMETKSIDYASDYAKNMLNQSWKAIEPQLCNSQGKTDILQLLQFIQQRIV
jgi:geranylgeranyl pyrophosphate synthase